jgi:Tol biopolymer transport system component
MVQDVWSVPAAGGEAKLMANFTGGRAESPVYSPDGTGLYFVVGPTLWMLPVSPKTSLAVGEPVKVTDAVASNITGLTFSADGKRMAYSVQNLTSNLWSIPISPITHVATETSRQITHQTGARNGLPAFSPDGRKLAFVGYERAGVNYLLVADADGQNPEQITTPSTRAAGPTWFPDGDQLSFACYPDNHFSVCASSLQTRRERSLLEIGRNIEAARLSPDGKKLVFNLSDEGITNVWTASLSDGQLKQLTFDKELAGFPCWSPDSKFIAYQMKRGDNAYLMVIPSDGGESTQLTSGAGKSWPFSWSPDGDKIVFAGERNGVWNVWWVSRSTREQKQLTNYTRLNGFVRYPAWSPLGNQIVFESAETHGNIWLMELRN